MGSGGEESDKYIHNNNLPDGQRMTKEMAKNLKAVEDVANANKDVLETMNEQVYITSEQECQTAANDTSSYTWKGIKTEGTKGCYFNNKLEVFWGSGGEESDKYIHSDNLPDGQKRMTKEMAKNLKTLEDVVNANKTMLKTMNEQIYITNDSECQTAANDTSLYTWKGIKTEGTKGCYFNNKLEVFWGSGGEESDKYIHSEDLPNGEKRMTKEMAKNLKAVEDVVNANKDVLKTMNEQVYITNYNDCKKAGDESINSFGVDLNTDYYIKGCFLSAIDKKIY